MAVVVMVTAIMGLVLVILLVTEASYRKRGWKPRTLDQPLENRPLPKGTRPYDGSEFLG